jgi:hypothetical protein
MKLIKFECPPSRVHYNHGTQLYNQILLEGGLIKGCTFNDTISQFEGRSQFNFEFGNYSSESDEILNEFIIKTQKL